MFDTNGLNANQKSPQTKQKKKKRRKMCIRITWSAIEGENNENKRNKLTKEIIGAFCLSVYMYIVREHSQHNQYSLGCYHQVA